MSGRVVVGFTPWLKRQHRREDAVGDLARDVRADPEWPSRARSLRPYHEYLYDRGAVLGALTALSAAWLEYSENIISKDFRAAHPPKPPK